MDISNCVSHFHLGTNSFCCTVKCTNIMQKYYAIWWSQKFVSAQVFTLILYHETGLSTLLREER